LLLFEINKYELIILQVDAVDDIIRQYDDFMTTLDAQSDKFDALKKLTLLEQACQAQRYRDYSAQNDNTQAKTTKKRTVSD
jgi:hypothetical protein